MPPSCSYERFPSFVSGGCANDRDLRNDGREEQPFVASEIDALDDRLRRRFCVHGAAFVDGIDERIHSHFCQNARPFRRRLAMNIKQDTRRHVVGRDRVAGDHLPDCRRLGGRWAGRIGASQNAGETSRLRQMVHALHSPHVARGDRMEGRQVPRMTFGLEPFSDRSQRGSGQPSAEDEETVTIAPSGMRRAASEAEITFCLPMLTSDSQINRRLGAGSRRFESGDGDAQ